MHRIILAAIAALCLSGCVSAPMNAQNPTATEQLLASHAARRAAAGANLVCRPPAADHCVARGARVWVRVLAGDDKPAGKAAVAEVLQHLGTGVILVDGAAEADVRVDLVVSAAAIDDEDHVVGVPPIAIPAIPGKTSSTTTTPEISIWSTHTRTGVVELDANAYDERSGRFITGVGPLSASSHLVRGSILTAISFGRARELPEIRTGER